MSEVWNAGKFKEKYAKNSDWGGHSGGGSSLHHTAPYRTFLENFLRLNSIRSVVDIGCGDWQFSRLVNWGDTSYVGFDVVEEIIEENRKRFASPQFRFEPMAADLAHIPDADLLIMKDVLQHMSDKVILRFVEELCPRFKYALLTNSYEKLETRRNIDIEDGQFRCLDLTTAPFNYDGVYVLEFGSQLWERLRTLLICR